MAKPQPQHKMHTCVFILVLAISVTILANFFTLLETDVGTRTDFRINNSNNNNHRNNSNSVKQCLHIGNNSNNLCSNNSNLKVNILNPHHENNVNKI